MKTPSSFRERHTLMPLFLEDFQKYTAEGIKEKLKDKNSFFIAYIGLQANGLINRLCLSNGI